MSEITSFPSDGYDGIVIERNIPLLQCVVITTKQLEECTYWIYCWRKGRVIGLSKLNRIVELLVVEEQSKNN
jgi:GTP cyclohydrolase IA